METVEIYRSVAVSNCSNTMKSVLCELPNFNKLSIKLWNDMNPHRLLNFDFGLASSSTQTPEIFWKKKLIKNVLKRKMVHRIPYIDTSLKNILW